jgi:hypothetical protein
MVISVPYHLDERIDAFDPGVPVDQEIVVELPSARPWERMAALYEQVACAVAGQSAPPVVAVRGLHHQSRCSRRPAARRS